jgi:hypothetical protein
MPHSRPPGIRLHLGYFRAGDAHRPAGEIRARLPEDEPPSDGAGPTTREVERPTPPSDIHVGGNA